MQREQRLLDDLREMLPRLTDGPDDYAKPRYPTNNELAETAAAMRVLATAIQPIATTEIARAFLRGRQIEKCVASTILALARLGHLSSPDGGETFSLRLAS